MLALLIFCATVVADREQVHMLIHSGQDFRALLWNLNGFATENKYLSRTVIVPLKPSFPRMLFGGNYVIEGFFPRWQKQATALTSVLGLGKSGLRVNIRLRVTHGLNGPDHPALSAVVQSWVFAGKSTFTRRAGGEFHTTELLPSVPYPVLNK